MRQQRVIPLTAKQAKGWRCPACGSREIGQNPKRGNTFQCLKCGTAKSIEAFAERLAR